MSQSDSLQVSKLPCCPAVRMHEALMMENSKLLSVLFCIPDSPLYTLVLFYNF